MNEQAFREKIAEWDERAVSMSGINIYLDDGTFDDPNDTNKTYLRSCFKFVEHPDAESWLLVNKPGEGVMQIHPGSVEWEVCKQLDKERSKKRAAFYAELLSYADQLELDANES